MSDLLLNWRFGAWHFQIHRNAPYITFERNQYWVEHKPESWFERY